MALGRSDGLSASASLRHHWPEYAMEVAELGSYLFVACVFATLLQHPASVVRELSFQQPCPSGSHGAGYGCDCDCNCDFTLGQTIGRSLQSGNHLHFLSSRKGRVLGYMVLRNRAVLRRDERCRPCQICVAGGLAHDAIRYAVTVPGMYGSTVAFVAELTISFFLMITVLFATNQKRLAPYTAYFVGILIATYFTFEV